MKSTDRNKIRKEGSSSGKFESADEKKHRMAKALKYGLFLLGGAAIALLLLGLYSWLINPYEHFGEPEELPPVKISDKDVFITGISGEVYIIRNEKILSADVGDSLKEGDVLKVVDQSYCQIQFSDRGTAGLDSNTVLLMKKLVNAQKDMQIRTEVLMGSMLYRVKKLSENDQFEVESDGVLYDVKGTEFLVIRSADGTLLAVEEGTVHFTVDGEEREIPLVHTGEQVFVSQDDRTLAPVHPIGESASLRIESLKGIDKLSVQSDSLPVTVMLETSPSGADIYLDGRKIAQGLFSGLFDVGSELDFLIRKRGYRDKPFHLSVKAGEDKIYLVELEPADLEETINEVEEIQSFESILNRMRQIHEEELKAQKLRFESSLDDRVTQLNALSDENLILEEDKIKLQNQLEQKNQEIMDLRTLMTQIQELSNQE
ncbi:MAG: FecR domain-containing protein [Spirochaetales bacterium]|nr:FecR domain-containing protein [Spirochaetales bacterium]